MSGAEVRRRVGGSLILMALPVLLAAAIGGCGSGAAEPTVPRSSMSSVAESRDGVRDLPAHDAQLSPAEIRAAHKAGQRACQGRAPVEAARHFAHAARRAGVTHHFAAIVSNPTANTKSSPGYPRLVASLYATTLPEAERTAGAAGCAEELAAPSRSDKAGPR